MTFLVSKTVVNFVRITLPARFQAARKVLGEPYADTRASRINGSRAGRQIDLTRAAEEVRRQIAFYASTPNYRHVLDFHGYAGLGEELSAMARRGEWEALPRQISDQMVQMFSVHASPAELPKALHARYGGLLGRVSLYFPIQAGDSDDRWRAFTNSFRHSA